MREIKNRAERLSQELVDWRRHLHARPERSFHEEETAAFVADVLDTIPGMDVKRNVGGHGVVGTLEKGQGPVVALRADMDALPIQEENDHSFASTRPGVMHACGHDAHTAILLGAAMILGERFQNDEAIGTVKFLFQPAEEQMDEANKTGALYMIEDGALDNVEAILALHVCPWLRPDAIQVNAGASMASVDVFTGTIRGSGGHGAYPHLGVDPVWLLSHVLPSIYGLTGRLVSPLTPAVVSVGRINAGHTSNVIPSEVTVEGTIRCYDEDVRMQLTEEIQKTFALANTFGGEGECVVEHGEPALMNDAMLTELLQASAKELYPELTVKWEPFGLGGEDFAHMTKAARGAMFFLGCQPEFGQYDLHTPSFQIDERCLPKGAAILVASTEQLLQNTGVKS
ncbi:M20 metallopeptidase family protein [Shouchella shacheensis]|uniref:M20 metallopeptidase family protein n=1 Tax=Shouchella shacheensis TaxID=1649580 RepID=UPI00073FFE4E|nr:amidohydrolase [Shouchella shacheensis]